MDWNDIVKSSKRSPGTKWGDDEEEDAEEAVHEPVCPKVEAVLPAHAPARTAQGVSAETDETKATNLYQPAKISSQEISSSLNREISINRLEPTSPRFFQRNRLFRAVESLPHPRGVAQGPHALLEIMPAELSSCINSKQEHESKVETTTQTQTQTQTTQYGHALIGGVNVGQVSDRLVAPKVEEIYPCSANLEPHTQSIFTNAKITKLVACAPTSVECSAERNADRLKYLRAQSKLKMSYADMVKANADAGTSSSAVVESTAEPLNTVTEASNSNSNSAIAEFDTANNYTNTNDIYKFIGNRVGLQSVQSVMMSATQNNLSHFHTAGMVNMQYSVHAPSSAEAMDFVYTNKNTGMKFMSNSLSERELRKYLVGANLSSFVLTVGSSLTDLPERENIWYEALGKEIDEGIVLRIYIDYNKMYDHGLTLYDLAHESFGDDCVWHVSPDFMGMIDVIVGDTLMSQWLSRMKTKVCGKFSILSCNRTLSNVNSNNFATTGTDMLAVCRIPGVDKRTVEMNNVLQVERHLGIEAAAKVLYNLIGNSEQNIPNNGKIISDFMARTGNILPFSKRSSEIRYKGVLTSMGFERPKDDIKREIHAHANESKQKNSTPFASKSKSKSVYEYIMNGKDIPVGFDIIS